MLFGKMKLKKLPRVETDTSVQRAIDQISKLYKAMPRMKPVRKTGQTIRGIGVLTDQDIKRLRKVR